MKHYCPTGRRNHGRTLKRLLGTWDRNGSTGGPTAWHIWWWWWWWWWWWKCVQWEPIYMRTDGRTDKFRYSQFCETPLKTSPSGLFALRNGRDTWNTDIYWKRRWRNREVILYELHRSSLPVGSLILQTFANLEPNHAGIAIGAGMGERYWSDKIITVPYRRRCVSG